MTTLLDLDYPKFQEFLLKTLQSGNFGVSRYKSKHLRKMHLKFLTRSIKHLTATNSGGGGVADCISGREGVQWLFYFVKSYCSCGKSFF